MKLPVPACIALLLAGAAHAQRPNVVLVVTDDQGDAAGCYGWRDARTPALDALAAEGVRFANGFCTTASCSPSRAALLSGLHGHANGTYGLQHQRHHFESFDDLRTLPALLAEAGWRTARVGKLHVAPDEVFPFETVVAAPARNPVAMAEACRPFVAAESDEPFFLYFCPSDPHRGGGALADVPGTPDRFGNRDYPGVERVRFDPAALEVPAWLPDSVAARAELAQFHESVARVDQGLAALVRVLREEGEWENTLFVFVSDHGPPFPGAKTTAYDPGLRVAFVVRDPGAPVAADSPGSPGSPRSNGRTVDALVSLVDVMPTVLEACGIEAPDELHGRSLLGWTRGAGPPDDWTDEIFVSHTFHEVTMYYPMRAVRTPRHKLVWNLAHPLPFPFASDLWRSSTWQSALTEGEDALYGRRTIAAYLRRPRLELYDLVNDPDELENLAGRPEHAELEAELVLRLRTFQHATRDPWRFKWERE